MPSPPFSSSPSTALPGPVSPGSPPRELLAPRADAGVRTSDQERQQVVELLHRAFAEGRLDLDEHEARVVAAYEARYRSEFEALLADLPAEAASRGHDGGVPTWAAVWASAVWRSRVTVFGTSGDTPPTSAQQRGAALVVVLALVWFAACAVVGALVVAA